MAGEIAGDCEAVGTGEVLQLLPVVEDAVLLGGLCHFADAVDGTHLRHEQVGGDSVAGRIYGMEQRHVAGQSDGGHHGAGLESMIAVFQQLLNIGIAALGEGIGTHAVDQYELDLTHIFRLLLMMLFVSSVH